MTKACRIHAVTNKKILEAPFDPTTKHFTNPFNMSVCIVETQSKSLTINKIGKNE
jgi:hypothetical protein